MTALRAGRRLSTMLAGAALAAFAVPAPAQEDGRADPPPGAVTATVDLIGSIDFERIAADPAAAEDALRLADTLAATTAERSVDRARIDGIRAMVLAAAARGPESVAIVDRVLARRFAEPEVYSLLWAACARLRDWTRMTRIVEVSAAAVPAADRPVLHEAFDTDSVEAAAEHSDESVLGRLYEALVAIDWPGESQAQIRDDFRLRLVDLRMARGDRRSAAALARRIDYPAAVLRLAFLKRYDGLISEGLDPSRLVRDMIARRDSTTAAALAERPGDAMALFWRVDFLTSTGRFAEVLALLRPSLGGGLATTAATGDRDWQVEQAAYALAGLGRLDEAAASFAALVARPIADNPGLLDKSINYASFLWQIGRSRESLDHIERLERDHGEAMNDFGRVWLWSTRVCALAELGRAGEARPWLERMRPILAGNDGLLMRAQLCLGDMAAAEALALERLGSDWPGPAVSALQDWQVAEIGQGPLRRLEARLAELRTRPAVAAALDRVGRTLGLPLARSIWGSF